MREATMTEEHEKTVQFGIEGARRALASSPDYEGSPADLIADIMHWCEANGRDFDKELQKARFYRDADMGLVETVDFPIP